MKPQVFIKLLGILILAGSFSYYALNKVSATNVQSPEAVDQVSETPAFKRNKGLKKAHAQKILEDIKASESKLTLVNLWATWCDPCKEEFPHLLKLRKKYKDQGLEVAFVSVDFASAVPAVHKFLNEHKVNFASYLKDQETEEFVETLYTKWSGAIPTSILFNSEATSLYVWNQAASYEEFERVVKQKLQTVTKPSD